MTQNNLPEFEIPAAPAPPALPPAGALTASQLPKGPHWLTIVVSSWLAISALIFLVLNTILPKVMGKLIGYGYESFDISDIPIMVFLLIAIAPVNSIIQVFCQKYHIDDEQLIVEMKFISHKTEKISFSKIQSVDITQPLVARFLGMAALRIDVGDGSKSQELRYVKRDDAYKLRNYFMARAHGEKISVLAGTSTEIGDVFADHTRQDEVLYQVEYRKIIITALLDLIPRIFCFLVFLGGISALSSYFYGENLLPILIPMMVLPFIGIIYQGVYCKFRDNFNFKITTTNKGGLRTTAGLTTLASASVPITRIQGIKIYQPFFWRFFGWWRMEIEVVGRSHLDSKNDKQDSVAKSLKTLLMPAGELGEAEVILDIIWPNFKMENFKFQSIPKRSRIFRWIDAHTYFWSLDDRMLITRGRLLRRTYNIVPHSRVQSVRLSQSWVQKLFDLANVYAHTPDGPVNLRIKHLDSSLARELVLGELERMRIARKQIRKKRIVTN